MLGLCFCNVSYGVFVQKLYRTSSNHLKDFGQNALLTGQLK